MTSSTGNPLTSFVNMNQTPQERQEKYAYIRSLGLSWQTAQRLRDFRWSKLQIWVGVYFDIQKGGEQCQEAGKDQEQEHPWETSMP